MEDFSLKDYIYLNPSSQWGMLDKLMNDSADILMVLDGHFKVQEANNSALLFNKKSKEDLLGLDVGDTLLCENVTEHKNTCGGGPDCKFCPIRRTLSQVKDSNQDLLSVNLLFTYKSSHIKTTALNVSVYVLSSQPEYYLLVAKSDDFNKQNHDLQVMNRMQTVGKLTSIIVHDFKNVVTSIDGYTNLASMVINDQNYVNKMPNTLTEVNTYLEKVFHSSRHAKSLIQQLLDYSKGKNNTPLTTYLDDEIDSALSIVKGILPKRIRLSYHTTKDKKLVYLQPSKFHEIVVNLVSNAIDAIQGEGRISINVYSCNKTLEERGLLGNYDNASYYALEIEDTGCGIPEDKFNEIFTPFFTTKGAEEGSGIGLYLVYSAMKELKGNINVVSQAEKGTKFTLYFRSESPSKTPNVKKIKTSQN